MSTTTTESDQTPASGSPEAGEMLRLDNQLCFALYAATGMVTRAYRPLLEPLGLTYPQYLAMLVLWERAPRTVSELGDALGLDSGTLTPLLKRLEAAGLVERRRDTADERRVQIHLTQAGEALKGPAGAVPLQILCKLNMPIEQLGSLKAALEQLAKGMDGTC